MTRDDIIRMAREAGWSQKDIDSLLYIVETAAAAERERLKQSIRHSLTIGPKTIQTRVYFGEEAVSMVKMPIEEVVAAEREACKQWFIEDSERFAAQVALAEREACARVCGELADNPENSEQYRMGANWARERIRARGKA